MRILFSILCAVMIIFGLGNHSCAAADQGNFVVDFSAKIESSGNNRQKVKYLIKPYESLFSGVNLEYIHNTVVPESAYDQVTDFRIQTVHANGTKKDYYARYMYWEDLIYKTFNEAFTEVAAEGLNHGKVLPRYIETGSSFKSINLFVKDQLISSLSNPGSPPQIKSFSARYSEVPEGGEQVPYVSFDWDISSGNGKWWASVEKQVNNIWVLINRPGGSPNFPGTGEFKHRVFDGNQKRLKVRLCVTDGFNRTAKEYILDADTGVEGAASSADPSEQDQTTGQGDEPAEEAPYKRTKQKRGNIEIWM